MTNIHIDLRELDGTSTDAPLMEIAWISFATQDVVHVEDGDDYLLTTNELEVKVINGEATVALPPTTSLNPMVARENKFAGARTKCLIIPDVGGTVEYGDLEEVACPSSTATAPAYWKSYVDAADENLQNQINNIIVGTVGYSAFARLLDAIIVDTITRDANSAALSADVVWPDGTEGVYTADTLSVDFPGAVDAYHVTYGDPVTATFTQPDVTRNVDGAVIDLPEIVVT